MVGVGGGEEPGGQIKAYDDEFGRMPLDVQLGVTKRFENMPFRLSLTAVDLTHWNYNAINHLVAGVDLMLGDQFYVSGGYNFRRAKEMKIAEGSGEEADESSHGPVSHSVPAFRWNASSCRWATPNIMCRRARLW